jgi:hypothetical protein
VAYACFSAAIILAAAAIYISLVTEHRLKRGRAELGRILVELSKCELLAYRGDSSAQYDQLLSRVEEIKTKVAAISRKYLDSTIESRFLAVNVLDVQLDEATRRNFIDRAQGSFWTVFQQLKGWRACVEGLLRELRS